MDAEANLDYNMLFNQGDKEYEDTMKALTERLEQMMPNEILKKQAEIADSMEKIMKGKPLKMITC